MAYIPLWVKTNYSLLSSLVAIDKLIQKAKQLQITSLAITDTNVLYGAMEFYQECQKNNIKPIIGLELELLDNIILLYARNFKGYQNLCQLVTFKSERDLDLLDIEIYNSNLVCIVPYQSRVLYEKLKSLFKSIYLGYSTHEEKNALNKNIPTIYINEILYLNKGDSQYLPYLYAIRDGKKTHDMDIISFNNNHLLTTEELGHIDNHDLNRTLEISNLCQVKFIKDNSYLPVFNQDINAKEYLIKLCKKGLAKRLNYQSNPQYLHRLEYELKIITGMDMANYFLVVYDFVKYAKKNNILVGPGRGSSASSLVSYSLGITDVDPLKYNLLFERFLNPKRLGLPDIDIDFPDIYRDYIIEYVINKYGVENTAQIITFGTFGMKQAIRDVGRVLDIPLDDINQITTILSDHPKATLTSAYRENKKFKALIDTTPLLTKLYKIASFLEGYPRHSSIHAAGIIIANSKLTNIIPLMRSNHFYVTGYSMEYLEGLGLLKMDFLGLRNLTTIMNIIESIKETDQKAIDFHHIPLNNPLTLKIFMEANTEGIFQFESTGMKAFLKKLKVANFEDIVAAIALFRPGPMANIDNYIKGRDNPKTIDYIHPNLEGILKPTHGIIIYQEQIMQIAVTMAGYDLGDADILRSAMSKKRLDILVNEKEKFINQSINKGYTKEVATKVYSLILKFANYGFNRAHSVAYSLISYKMAYLKAHYPKHFSAHLLTSAIGSSIKTKQYLSMATQNNIKILKPDINLSTTRYEAETLGIRMSLTNIRNIGPQVSDNIVQERKEGLYLGFIDFVVRTYGQRINRKVIESLIFAGCFSSFGYNKKTLVTNLDTIINYAELIQDLDASLIDKPVLVVVEEYNKNELMKQELNVFGFLMSHHPLIKYKNNYDNLVDIINLPHYFNQSITILVYVENIKEITTKTNEKMAFILGSDEMGKIDIILFPKVYHKYPDIRQGNILKITGRVEKRLSKYQVIADKINILN